jgi:hypothetical protein
MSAKNDSVDDGITCDICGIPIDACTCSCPYCGERDSCECCLYDAATGGGWFQISYFIYLLFD